MAPRLSVIACANATDRPHALSTQIPTPSPRRETPLIVLPPTLPTTALIGPFVERLAAAIAEHNRKEEEAAARLQLRLAVHVGPIMPDGEGLTGASIIHAARLLDAAKFKKALAGGADLGLIASQYVYDTVVRHESPHGYRQIRVSAKETRTTAWFRLLGPGC